MAVAGRESGVGKERVVKSILDSAEFNRRLFAPPLYDGATPPDAEDLRVPVDDDVCAHGRVYPCPTPQVRVLLFHGNGEDVDAYVRMAGRLARSGVALTVFGYRGSALSTGQPTLRSALNDGHPVFRHLQARAEPDPPKPWLVMGRSLGSGPAIELAASEPGRAGLIVESGYADPYRLIARRGFTTTALSEDDLAVFSNCRKMERVRVPVLVLHGREDALIHPDEAVMNYEAAGSACKRLALLDGAGHNDIGIHALYYPTLERFLAGVVQAGIA